MNNCCWQFNQQVQLLKVNLHFYCPYTEMYSWSAPRNLGKEETKMNKAAVAAEGIVCIYSSTQDCNLLLDSSEKYHISHYVTNAEI